MAKRTLLYRPTIVNRGRRFTGSVIVEGETIAAVLTGDKLPEETFDQVIDAQGCYLLPGVIDEHVHLREPGLTHKADITTESRAAVAGGVTSIIDMPNTVPQTVTIEALEQKQQLLREKCVVNHACWFGATNDNAALFAKLPAHEVCGVKLFMGSSTGNMLVSDTDRLKWVFESTDKVIMTHNEAPAVIARNAALYTQRYGTPQAVPVEEHEHIRSEEACYRSTELAVWLARETGARLHVAHLSTARELALIDQGELKRKRVTGEACIPHLMFTHDHYATLGALIKCNPAIKTPADRDALRQAVGSGLIDTIATDHAPHLPGEKQGGALTAAPGMPMVQFSLPCMLQLVDEGVFSIETVVQKMCHNPATLLRIARRGFIDEGYQADLVLVRPDSAWTVRPSVIQSKCGWSPLAGQSFNWRVERTFVNGHQAYCDGVVATWEHLGQPLYFE